MTSCSRILFVYSSVIFIKITLSIKFCTLALKKNWVKMLKNFLNLNSDIFCDEDGTREFNKAYVCPACE